MQRVFQASRCFRLPSRIHQFTYIRPMLQSLRHSSIKKPDNPSSVACTHKDSLATATATPPQEQNVQGNLIIGFTCKVCSTRQYKSMSKQAYHKGVVIIRCDGCKKLHLIADHLGWYDSMKHIGSLEDIMRAKGEGVKKVTLNGFVPTGKQDSLEWVPELEKVLDKEDSKQDE